MGMTKGMRKMKERRKGMRNELIKKERSKELEVNESSRRMKKSCKQERKGQIQAGELERA